jgi:DnaK suppressor protein
MRTTGTGRKSSPRFPQRRVSAAAAPRSTRGVALDEARPEARTHQMEQKKMKGFKDRLLLKKQEILVAYTKNKSYGKEADEEGSQDIADKASNSYTKEFLFSLSNTERDMLQLVDEALVRIDDRRFGTCVVCEEELDKKRLEAVPWAKRCISCQEKQEQGLL